MPDQYRDDCPTAFNLARRKVLVGGLVIGGLAALPTLPVIAAPTSWSDQSAARFMEISLLLVPHRLNEEIGKRMGAAMGALNPSLSQQIDGLLSIAREKNARIVEDFFTDAPDAEVFAYEYALMYQPTRDVMTIPSYAISGPNGWTAEAPPLSNMPEF
jgi:hypothetical protein